MPYGLLLLMVIVVTFILSDTVADLITKFEESSKLVNFERILAVIGLIAIDILVIIYPLIN